MNRLYRFINQRHFQYAALLILAAVYLGSVTDSLTTDSVIYATGAIKDSLRGQLHPHHLIYTPLLSLIVRYLATSVPSRNVLLVLQVVNAAVSLGAVCALVALLQSITDARLLAYLLGGVLGFANAFWGYAAQIEVYNWAVFLVVITLFSMVRESRHPWLRIIGPVALTTSMLFHQTAVFVTAATLAYSLQQKDRLDLVLRYTLLPIVLTAIIYMAASAFVTSQFTLSSLWRFVTAYAHEGKWGIVRSVSSRNAAFGFINSILFVETGCTRILAVTILLSSALFLGLNTKRLSNYMRQNAQSGYRPIGSLCGSWIILHAVFVWWWDPGNLEFWVVMLPGILVLVAILIRGTAVKPQTYQRIVLGLCGVLLLELGFNTFPMLLKRMTPSTSVVFAHQVASITSKDDSFVIIGEGPADAYLAYYCPCHVVQLRLLRDTNQVSTRDVVARLAVLFDETIARGGRVFVIDQVIRGESENLRVYDLLTLDVAELCNWLHSYTWKQHEFEHGSVFELAQYSR